MDNGTGADAGRLREERRAFWRGHVDGQRASGLGVKAYCESHGLKPWQWHYWRNALSPRADSPGGFVEVRAVKGAALTVWCGACRIDVAPGFDPAHLRAVVAALGAA